MQSFAASIGVQLLANCQMLYSYWAIRKQSYSYNETDYYRLEKAGTLNSIMHKDNATSTMYVAFARNTKTDKPNERDSRGALYTGFIIFSYNNGRINQRFLNQEIRTIFVFEHCKSFFPWREYRIFSLHRPTKSKGHEVQKPTMVGKDVGKLSRKLLLYFGLLISCYDRYHAFAIVIMLYRTTISLNYKKLYFVMRNYDVKITRIRISVSRSIVTCCNSEYLHCRKT